jgi:hypothetical protein
MPPEQELPDATEKLPNVLLWDKAYPLETYLLKPYTGKNLTPDRSMFNYWCTECIFGILHSKWCILGKDTETLVQTATVILKCVCIPPTSILDGTFKSDATNINNR